MLQLYEPFVGHWQNDAQVDWIHQLQKKYYTLRSFHLAISQQCRCPKTMRKVRTAIILTDEDSTVPCDSRQEPRIWICRFPGAGGCCCSIGKHGWYCHNQTIHHICSFCVGAELMGRVIRVTIAKPQLNLKANQPGANIQSISSCKGRWFIALFQCGRRRSGGRRTCESTRKRSWNLLHH